MLGFGVAGLRRPAPLPSLLSLRTPPLPSPSLAGLPLRILLIVMAAPWGAAPRHEVNFPPPPSFSLDTSRAGPSKSRHLISAHSSTPIVPETPGARKAQRCVQLQPYCLLDSPRGDDIRGPT